MIQPYGEVFLVLSDTSWMFNCTPVSFIFLADFLIDAVISWRRLKWADIPMPAIRITHHTHANYRSFLSSFYVFNWPTNISSAFSLLFNILINIISSICIALLITPFTIYLTAILALLCFIEHSLFIFYTIILLVNKQMFIHSFGHFVTSTIFLSEVRS